MSRLIDNPTPAASGRPDRDDRFFEGRNKGPAKLVRHVRQAITPLAIPTAPVVGALAAAYNVAASYTTQLPSIGETKLANTHSPLQDGAFTDFLFNKINNKREGVILDIGGTGQLNATLGKDARVVNLNYSQFHLKEGDIRGDARKLPLAPGSVRTACMSGLLEYFTQDEALAVLREAHDALAPDGTVVLSEARFHSHPTMDRGIAHSARVAASIALGGQHIQYRNDDDMEGLLRQAGFDEVEHVPYLSEKGLREAYVVVGKKIPRAPATDPSSAHMP